VSFRWGNMAGSSTCDVGETHFVISHQQGCSGTLLTAKVGNGGEDPCFFEFFSYRAFGGIRCARRDRRHLADSFR
jgi:hypothetical protein